MLRNNKVAIYSSRFVDEMKTFIWTNNKAQAQRGKNDDLVMSLAIGLWLYDAKGNRRAKKVDLNAAMLAGFAMNKKNDPPQADMSPFNQQVSIFTARGMPVHMDDSHPLLSGSTDFKWLL